MVTAWAVGRVPLAVWGCGLWAVGCELWAVGCGLWAVGCGPCGSDPENRNNYVVTAWAVGRGLWAVGCGLWAVGRVGQILRIAIITW